MPQPASVARPVLPSRAIAVTTTAAVPGREVAAVIGDVVGVVVRPRELPPELRVGNPIDGYAAMLTRSRQDAVTKMIDMAVGAGADAVIGFGYDSSEITQSLSEVAAFGTAVKLAPEAGLASTADRTAEGRTKEDHAVEDLAVAEQRTGKVSASVGDQSSAATPSAVPRRPTEREASVRDQAAEATTLSRPASSSAGGESGGNGDDRSWPPSSWPSQS
jgi:uncharacterized protein YbjQ (UPF0145 family)